MNTLHIDTRPDWRGGQNQILLLLRGLRARGHGAELMVLRGSPLEGRAGAEGFTVHAFSPGLVRLSAASHLRGILKAGRFDIVHAHDPHGLTAVWLAGAHHRTALVAARRVVYPLSSSRVALARYRATRRILAVSALVAQSVIASGIDAARVAVVHDGIEMPPATTAETRRQARARWGAAEDDMVLGCVGYLLPDKGQEALIRVLPAVRAGFPRSRLLLAGDGPCRTQLEKLAHELGVTPAVIFAGFVEEIGEVYRALDIFLFSALDEGLGSSLLEAMAYGLPVIAVTSGGVPEIVENERNGLLVPAFGEGSSSAIVELLADRAKAARLGAAARETVAARFSADRMVEGTLEEYQKILAVAAR